MRRFYVVTAVMPWSSIRVEETGLPIRVDDPTSAGYMEVYTTWEAAEASRERARAAGTPAGRSEILVFKADTPPAVGGREDGQP